MDNELFSDLSPASDLFTEIIGHSAQVQQLRSLVARSMMPHAILLSGPSGIGKRCCALAQAALLLAGSTEGSNEQSALVRAGTHPDVHYLGREEGKRDISVDAIRELRSRLHLKPYAGRAIIAIIDDAQRMNAPAYNALLKTLEEPHANTFLFLTTTSLHTLPATIVSRCQVLHFSELAVGEVERILTRIVPEIIENEAMRRTALELCRDSLAPLELETFVNPKRIALSTSPQLIKHCTDQFQRYASIRNQIDGLVESRDTAQALSTASDLSQQKGTEALIWRCVRDCLIDYLRRKPSPQAAHCLQRSLESEHLVLQRNLSLNLVLSEVLVQVSELRSFTNSLNN